LRFEGIDALELHFESAIQPRLLTDQARGFLIGKLTMNPVPYNAPTNLRVARPAHQLTKAAARAKKLGLWAADLSTTGLKVFDQQSRQVQVAVQGAKRNVYFGSFSVQFVKVTEPKFFDGRNVPRREMISSPPLWSVE
jgi:hypothetical protein